MILLIAGFLLLTAIANIACCHRNGCAVNFSTRKKTKGDCNMKNGIIRNKLYFIGAIIGAIAGFLYWKYVGCLTGTCTITSSPLNSAIYFALFGAVLFGTFTKQSKPTKTHKQ